MSNSAVASLPVRVKIANSPPGCWERKYIENASVQDNPDFSFLGVLINFFHCVATECRPHIPKSAVDVFFRHSSRYFWSKLLKTSYSVVTSTPC